MASDDAEKPDAVEFLEALYGDPLRRETSRAGILLTVVGLAEIAVLLFGGKLTATSFFPVSFGDRADVLPMLMALVVLLLTVGFALRALTDFFRSKEARLLIARYVEHERVAAVERSARAIDEQQPEQEGEGDSEPDPWWVPVFDAQQAAERNIRRLEERLGLRRAPRVLRAIRLWAEIGVPLLIGCYGIVTSMPQLLALGRALLQRNT